MTDSLALTTQQQEPGAIQVLPAQLATIDAEIRQFEFDWRKAQALSRSRMVPAHFQGKAEDCMVAVMMARQLGINDLLALQNIQLIQGRPGFSASFAIGLANTRGPFSGPITWSTEGSGDNLKVTARAIVATTGEEVSTSVDMSMAKAEGWVKNPKYRSMPEQMLRYRAATWLIRLHCPEVLMGLSSSDELEDTRAAESKAPAARAAKQKEATVTVEELNKQIEQRKEVQPQEVAEEVQPLEINPSGSEDDPFM
jgi:hypothetical protein